MERDDQDLEARIAALDARAAELRERAADRQALTLREAELEAEIAAARARLEARGGKGSPGSPLDEVRIASPCTAVWADMEGDDRVRHCKVCRKNVFDLSAMTKREAERVLTEHESPCVRLYRRRDGTVMTADCPVGRRRLQVRRIVAVTGTAAVLAALAFTAGDSDHPIANGAVCGLGAARSAADRTAQRARDAAEQERIRERERNTIMGAAPRRLPTAHPRPPLRLLLPASRGDKSS